MPKKICASVWLCTIVGAGFGTWLFGENRAAGQAQRGEAARPADTSELVVFLEPGTDVRQFAWEHGMVVKRALRGAPDGYVLSAPSVAAAKAAQGQTRGDGRVRASFANRRSTHVPMGFAPNDPYFHKDTPEAGWPGQWCLLNEHTPGLDARVQGAWNRDVTGEGVTIGILDDCLQIDHPDLAPNYVAADSWDFADNDPDPSPVFWQEMHGVATAGVAAARGGNGIGVTGAAPHAGLAGLRLWFGDMSSAFVEATLYHSSGSDTSIKIKNHSYGTRNPFTATPDEEYALGISAEAGTIHCLAAGNAGMDANGWDLQNGPNGICVAALGSDGTRADYSNYGACVFVTCPSSSTGYFRVTTTDRTGELDGYNGSEDWFPDPDYTYEFGGTSAASPLAAGVIALGKQVRPNLDVRFAKHVLALTSDVVDPYDSTERSAGGWKTNAAGYHFNPNYGFGLIDADEFTARLAEYSGVTPPAQEDTGVVSVGVVVPPGDPNGVQQAYTVAATSPTEVVEVHMSIASYDTPDLEIWLTAPSGTTSRVFGGRWWNSNPDPVWGLTSNAFWGENPAGTWTLQVRRSDWWSEATWVTFRVITHTGRLIRVPPSVTSITPNTGRNDVAIRGAVVEGTHFVAGQTSVRLASAGQPDIVATNVVVAGGGNSLTCDLDLRGASPNAWDVVIAVAGSPTPATLSGGFTVTQAVYVGADFDRDGDVDLDDFAQFQLCFNGPNEPPPCAAPPTNGDLDGDGDVDLVDYNVLVACFNGANRAPVCPCPAGGPR